MDSRCVKAILVDTKVENFSALLIWMEHYHSMNKMALHLHVH